MKHTKRRIWALILCLTMLISLIPTYGVEVKAEESEGTFSHTVTFDAGLGGTFEDGTQTLTQIVSGNKVPENYVSSNCVSGNQLIDGGGYGGKVTKPVDPTNEQSYFYQFDGWYYDNTDYTSEDERWDFEKHNVIGDVTLYARWKQSLGIGIVQLGYEDTEFQIDEEIYGTNGDIRNYGNKSVFCKYDVNKGRYLQSSVIEELNKLAADPDCKDYKVAVYESKWDANTYKYIESMKLISNSLTEFIQGLDQGGKYWQYNCTDAEGKFRDIRLVSSQFRKGTKQAYGVGFVTSFTYNGKTIYRTFHDDYSVSAGQGYVREADEILSAFGIEDTAVSLSSKDQRFHFEENDTKIYVWTDFKSDSLTITGNKGTYSFECQSLKMLDNAQALVNVSAGNEILVAVGETKRFGDILQNNGVPHAGGCVKLSDSTSGDGSVAKVEGNEVTGVSAGTTTITGTVGTSSCAYWGATGSNYVTIHVKVVDKVYFDLNGGTGTALAAVLPGYITMPKTSARFKFGNSSYDFKGWSKDPYADTPEYEAGKSYNVTSGTLYAIYDVSDAKKELTFISDGKTVSTQKVLPGQPVVAPESITKEGYVLEGWYKEEALTNKYDFETEKMPEESLTLYAKWLKEYKAVIDKNDGTKPTTIGQLKATGTIPAPADPTREGYVFDGWYCDKDFKTECDFNKTVGELAGEDGVITIYAKWLRICKAVIDYNYDAKKDTIEGLSAESPIPVPTAPTRDGYTFGGWYYDQAFTRTWNFDDAIGNFVDENGVITIYAKWIENAKTYEISGHVYDSDGTTGVAGAAVKLMKGNREYTKTTTNEAGEYSFTGIGEGIYNIVVTANTGEQNGSEVSLGGGDNASEKMVTKLVEITSENLTGINVILPEKVLKSVVETNNTDGEVTPDVMVGGLDELAGGAVGENDSGAKVSMIVEAKKDLTSESEDNLSDEQKEIKKQQESIKEGPASAKGNLKFIDMEIQTETYNNGSWTKGDNITDTEAVQNKVLTIIIPFDLAGKYNLTIFRCHGNASSAFTKLGTKAEGTVTDGTFYLDIPNNLIYVYASKFSTYAIGYDDKSIEIKAEGDTTLTKAGDTVQLTAEIKPESDPKPTVTWKSENEQVATVDANGLVTAKGTGTAKVTAEIEDGKYKAEITITVEIANTPSNGNSGSVTVKVPVTGVTIRTDKDTFTKAGETARLTAVITPGNATNPKVTWKSENEKVATVDANGVVTAVGEGTTKVIVTTDDGKKTAEILITVKFDENKPSEGSDAETGDTESGDTEVVKPSIDIAKNNMILNSGFKVSVSSKALTVSWAKVDGAEGYVVYAEYCGSKVMDKIKVIQNADTTSYKITKINGKALNTKKPYKVYVVAYNVENGKKVRIAKSITAHVVGVKNAAYTNAKSIKLAKTKVQLSVGKTSQIKAATVLVDAKKKQLGDSHTKEFRYASSDKSVATVTSGGKIKAVGKGSCTVYVYARNGYAKKVTVTVK